MKWFRWALLACLLLSCYPLGAFAVSQNTAIYRQINTNRRAHSRQSLILSSRLSAVAQQRAALMATTGVFAHTIPGQATTWEMVRRTGYTFTAGGEVIGLNYTDPKKLVRAWELSTAHRSILYSRKYNQVGIGRVYVKNRKNVGVITVAIFAQHPKNTP